MNRASTGLAWDPRFAWYNAGEGQSPVHFFRPFGATDSPQSKERIYEMLVASGLVDELVALRPRLTTTEELLLYHPEHYIQRIRHLSETGGGDAGDEGYVGANCFDIVRLAAGTCIESMVAVMEGKVDNVYALVRPCGHHASADFGRGFSIVANIPIAILALKSRHLVERVAVVDWDVHHGNGTQEAFYADNSVLTISMHQDGLYPEDSGKLTERGQDQGLGYNINIPLPAGSGHGAYVAAMNEVIVPALYRFKPELVVVASGLDANARDPLSSMLCHSGTYREMTRILKSCATQICGGRLALCHEGGYAADYVPYCGLAIMEELCGVETDFTDPVLQRYARMNGQSLLPHQQKAVRQAAVLVSDLG